MARTIPSEKRRIKQVKVNLSVSELNELDKYVAENGSDRSTILRDSFEQFLKLKSTVSEVKNGIERVQSDANKSYTPLYKGFPRAQEKLDLIKETLLELRDNGITSSEKTIIEVLDDLIKEKIQKQNNKSSENPVIEEKDKTLLGILNYAIKQIRNSEKTLYEADEIYHSELVDYLKILDKAINNEDSRLESSKKKNENISNKSNNDIVILEISESQQKYELVDQLNKGNSIISNFKNLNNEDVEKTLDFEFILGGVYALQARQEKLSNSMYLFSPKEISIDKLTKEGS